jgi:hypothetical protein
MKQVPGVVLTAILLLAGQPLKSNVFGDISNALKRQQNSIGNGIGRAVGVKLGGTLETATAPALDNAASKFTEVVKSAAGTLDQSLQAENESVDTIARRNVERIDTLTQATLHQVDDAADARLQQLQVGAVNLLDREAGIVDNALKQENTIANNALDRIEAISGQSLSRLQAIEGDAFDRIDSALQDQVPVAASQVAHEFVIAAVVVVLIVALFGFAGISLWKNLQQAKGDGSSWGQILKKGFRSFLRTLPQEAAVVVLPTLLVAAVILGGYEGYLRSTRTMRVTRLEKAASLLEATGEYKVAAQLRKRVMDVAGDSDSVRKEFAYQADIWLADFSQKTSVNASDLIKRLTLLEGNQLASSSADLQAANIYLRAELYGDFDPAAANRFRETFLNGKSVQQTPFMGKLVLMTQLKADLDREAPASERVKSCLQTTERLRALYPNYANGHLLAALLLGMQADGLANNETRDANREAELRKEVSAEIARAASLDPDLLRIVRLNNTALPADLLRDMDENPRNPGLAGRLGKYASTDIDPLARAILVSDVLTHQAVDRAILNATRRGVGERRIARAIKSLPASANPQQRASAMVSIAQQFFDIDSYLPAESWAEAAEKTLAGANETDPKLKNKMDSLCEALTQAKISTDLTAVI